MTAKRVWTIPSCLVTLSGSIAAGSVCNCTWSKHMSFAVLVTFVVMFLQFWNLLCLSLCVNDGGNLMLRMFNLWQSLKKQSVTLEMNLEACFCLSLWAVANFWYETSNNLPSSPSYLPQHTVLEHLCLCSFLFFAVYSCMHAVLITWQVVSRFTSFSMNL